MLRAQTGKGQKKSVSGCEANSGDAEATADAKRTLCSARVSQDLVGAASLLRSRLPRKLLTRKRLFERESGLRDVVRRVCSVGRNTAQRCARPSRSAEAEAS